MNINAVSDNKRSPTLTKMHVTPNNGFPPTPLQNLARLIQISGASALYKVIMDFFCCPLSRVLHVILANLQKFGFEFHQRSLPSAFSGLLHYLQLPHPGDETQQSRNSCSQLQFLAFSLDSIISLSSHCYVSSLSIFD